MHGVILDEDFTIINRYHPGIMALTRDQSSHEFAMLASVLRGYGPKKSSRKAEVGSRITVNRKLPSRPLLESQRLHVVFHASPSSWSERWYPRTSPVAVENTLHHIEGGTPIITHNNNVLQSGSLHQRCCGRHYLDL